MVGMVCRANQCLFFDFASDPLNLILQSEAEIPLNSSLQSGCLSTGSFAGLDSRECALIFSEHRDEENMYMMNRKRRSPHPTHLTD